MIDVTLLLLALGFGGDDLRLSDEVLPPQGELVPERPNLLLELGDPLYASGPLREGFEIPTGAVWQPSLLVFGQYRTALQTFDSGALTTTEWANRLDLFANLQLSGTERVLVGLRPLDNNGHFSGYTFEPEALEGGSSEFNLRPSHFFFEGDFGEIFPGLDRDDSGALDIGFSVGRQPILLQDGLLVNDRVDSLVVTRNTAFASNVSNLRVSGLIGWNDLERGDNIERPNSQMVGLLVEADREESTLSLDTLFVHDGDGNSDAFYAGLGAVQRFGRWNTTGRVVTSYPLHFDTSAASQGTLLFGELSTTVHGSDNLAYLNAFYGFGEFSSAARSPETGGPLGRVGILFEAVGLGSYGAALGNNADHAFGAALGYQMFLGSPRRQLVLELGAREENEGPDTGAVAAGASFQQAFGQHTILRFDAFVSGREDLPASHGGRFELRFKF